MRTPHTLAVALIALASTGCAPEVDPPRLICHNANCVEPANPAEDDTPEALEASLALEDGAGRPLVDGVELDTFWQGGEERCLFAHDLNDLDSASPIDVARQIVLEHLGRRHAAGQPLTRTPGPFSVFIELKGHVTESKEDKHSPDQITAHAACATDLGIAFDDLGVADGFAVEIVYTSFDAALLQAVDADLEARGRGRRRAKLGFLVGVPAPLDSQSKPLDAIPADLEIDMLDAHPHWARHGALEAAESLGWELALWMFSVVPETYDAIERYRPHYVTTSEARALAGWFDERGL